MYDDPDYEGPLDESSPEKTKKISNGIDIERDTEIIEKYSDSISSEDTIKKFPADCYSLMALHSPFESPFYFYFGLLVWVFQMLFFLLLVLRVASPKLSTNEDTDNPNNNWVGNFIPSNVEALSRATQFMAVLSYCIFADESLKDVITAVEMWPTASKAKPEDRLWLLMISTILRFAQGFLATVVVFLMVINTADVVDIVLNFTAVNFVSAFDDVAFELARWGKYGPGMEAETKRIEELPVPECLRRKTNYRRFWSVLIPFAASLLVMLTVVAVRQDSPDHWWTTRLRVQFEDGTNMESYSGCYDMVRNTTETRFETKRITYSSFHANPAAARFAYCRDKRKWFLYEGKTTNACDIKRDQQVAYSDITYSFDISSSFESSWYSRSGTPLELYFFDDNEANLTSTQCGEFLGDGKCNPFFNVPEYDFDQGDCCAETCNYLHCGTGTLNRAFNTPILTGDGYPYCQDTTMKPITILLNAIYLTPNEKMDTRSAAAFGRTQEDREPLPPLMSVDCNGRNVLMLSLQPVMVNQTEVFKASNGATCTMTVKSRSIGYSDVWHVKYTIFHGDRRSIEENPVVIYKGDSYVNEKVTFERIDECYFDKVKDHINISNVYTGNDAAHKAIRWLIRDTSGFTSCEAENFIERYALAAINFAAPLDISVDQSRDIDDDDTANQGLWITGERHCVWDHVGCVDGKITDIVFDDSTTVSGTVATEIGLLRYLSVIEMGSQLLTGRIPSEIGRLDKMKRIQMGNNAFTGTIPTEIGQLTNLESLDLSHNARVTLHSAYEGELLSPGLNGTIPSEILQLTSLLYMNLGINSITGSIPNEIGALSTLRTLVLDANYLTGIIPTSVAEIQALLVLELSYNLISGTIPSELGLAGSGGGNLTVKLPFNNLTGSVPLELLSNARLKLDGNRLSNLVPVDGSVICKSEPSQVLAYTGNAGDHYCDCNNDCFFNSAYLDPNSCACEEGRACCSSILSEATECIVCKYGLSNPNYIPRHPQNYASLTCKDWTQYIRTEVSQYGLKQRCDDTKWFFATDFKCSCNEELQEAQPECILCEHGMSNPNYIPNHPMNDVGATCGVWAKYVRSERNEYGSEAACSSTRMFFANDLECVCNEGVTADAKDGIGTERIPEAGNMDV